MALLEPKSGPLTPTIAPVHHACHVAAEISVWGPIVVLGALTLAAYIILWLMSNQKNGFISIFTMARNLLYLLRVRMGVCYVRSKSLMRGVMEGMDHTLGITPGAKAGCWTPGRFRAKPGTSDGDRGTTALSQSPPTAGIIIKSPAMLETIGSCRTVIFGKTSTLTYGKPALTEILCAPSVPRQRVLQMAASLEQYSKHPLAGSVLEAARRENVDLAQVSQTSEKPGQGLSGSIGPTLVQITGRKDVLKRGGTAASQLTPAAASMECILLLDGEYAATFRFHDAPRKESSAFIKRLAPRHQVKKVMLVSGDREVEVRSIWPPR